MMDGRVKTLHPTIFGGILARRSRPDDLEAIRAQRIQPIDLVVVNLYPFGKAADNPDTPFDALVEEIDIGGPSLLRAAAKNFRDVLVVVHPEDYPRVLAGTLARRRTVARLPIRADEAGVHAHGSVRRHDCDDDGARRCGERRDDAASGEAADEHAARRSSSCCDTARTRIRRREWIQFPPDSGRAWKVHQGKELSYTNLLDLDAALRIVLEFTEPAAVVIKHTNPCGVATGATIDAAYVRARDADPLSAFGGIVGLNRHVDVATARAIDVDVHRGGHCAIDRRRGAGGARREAEHACRHDRFLEGVRAAMPGSDRSGVALVSGRRAACRSRPGDRGGGAVAVRRDFPKVVTKRQPTAEEWMALRFAWRVCAHVKSNAVIFTGADRTLAIGAGQMSRVDAVKVAVMKAGGSLAGSVAASDAFFPFRDGLDAIAAAGRDRGRAARRVGARRGGDRRRRRARPGDGVHRPAAFPALIVRWLRR